MSYIGGVVLPVPTANKARYIELAKRIDQHFIDFGAVRIVECWEDDVPDGKQTDFRRAVQAKPDESVVFAWVEWPDKATRDAAMQKMHSGGDQHNEPMPFDMKRLIFGGFTPVVDLGKGQ